MLGHGGICLGGDLGSSHFSKLAVDLLTCGAELDGDQKLVFKISLALEFIKVKTFNFLGIGELNPVVK